MTTAKELTLEELNENISGVLEVMREVKEDITEIKGETREIKCEQRSIKEHNKEQDKKISSLNENVKKYNYTVENGYAEKIVNKVLDSQEKEKQHKREMEKKEQELITLKVQMKNKILISIFSSSGIIALIITLIFNSLNGG